MKATHLKPDVVPTCQFWRHFNDDIWISNVAGMDNQVVCIILTHISTPRKNECITVLFSYDAVLCMSTYVNGLPECSIIIQACVRGLEIYSTISTIRKRAEARSK